MALGPQISIKDLKYVLWNPLSTKPESSSVNVRVTGELSEAQSRIQELMSACESLESQATTEQVPCKPCKP